jgi:hypothetical protein
MNLLFLPTLLGNSILYGSAALLVRELARRQGPGWVRIVILAMSFAVFLEGVVLQSLFNPHFPGFGSLGVYGHVLGVNWVWGAYVIGLHTVWSITLPILLTELLFPARRTESWVGPNGLKSPVIAFAAVVLATMVTFYVATRFLASLLLLACAALLAVGLVLLALRMPTTPQVRPSGKRVRHPPSPWLIGLFAFLVGVVFFGVHELFPARYVIPAAVPILMDIALAVSVIVLLRLWVAPGRGWKEVHSLALVTGALLDTLLVGFFIIEGGSIADLILHIVLCVATIACWRSSIGNFTCGRPILSVPCDRPPRCPNAWTLAILPRRTQADECFDCAFERRRSCGGVFIKCET